MDSTKNGVVGYQVRRSAGALDVVSVQASNGQYAVTSGYALTLSAIRVFILNSFLPVDYPDSVAQEYLEYQIYDSLQALCSYLRGVLCTHALLTSAGVGSEQASAHTAAVTWILSDGIGMASSILFSSRYSNSFGVFVKEWRLFADIINDVGLVLDILSPFFPSYMYIYVLSASAICKTMCGISAGATKLCITNHLSRRNNASDLHAKEGSQETAVSLFGLMLGVGLAKLMGGDTQVSMLVFAFLTALHVYANYKAVACLRLQTINRSRCWLLLHKTLSFVQDQCSFSLEKSDSGMFEKVMETLRSDKSRTSELGISIAAINSAESFGLTLQVCLSPSRRVVIGCSLDLALRLSPGLFNEQVQRWHRTCDTFSDEPYCILPRSNGGWTVVLKQHAKKEDYMKAYSHCVFMSECLRKENIRADELPFSTKNTFNEFWKFFVRLIAEEKWVLSDEFLQFDVGDWIVSTDKALFETKKLS